MIFIFLSLINIFLSFFLNWLLIFKFVFFKVKWWFWRLNVAFLKFLLKVFFLFKCLSTFERMLRFFFRVLNVWVFFFLICFVVNGIFFVFDIFFVFLVLFLFFCFLFWFVVDFLDDILVGFSVFFDGVWFLLWLGELFIVLLFVDIFGVVNMFFLIFLFKFRVEFIFVLLFIFNVFFVLFIELFILFFVKLFFFKGFVVLIEICIFGVLWFKMGCFIGWILVGWLFLEVFDFIILNYFY